MTRPATDAAGAPAAPITFVGGKGGVGKTTLAAAHALALADAGHRVLVISTDPAHSLGDALETPLKDDPVRVAPNLWAAEPDADAAVRRRIAQVAEDARRAVPREVLPAVRRHLEQAGSSPGMAESALADLLVDRMEEVGSRWDALVVDSAPTGHLLRLLNLPTLLTPWVVGLARQRERARRAEAFADVVGGPTGEDDPLTERLHARRHRLERAAERLRRDAVVRLVTLPRRMVLAETARAVEQLTGAGFRLAPVIVNQIPSGDAAGPDTDEALAATRARFTDLGTVEIPLQGAEPTGPEHLRRLAAHLTPR
ncbi:arsenic-transporting ATPase [Nocardiopsis sp. TSRI0078]|uniref:ArsA family ATPase n=1 Tax=unclassified Nocardiopsis TaxID=2649073 RepID=UPI000939ABDB|nr:ArsA family ATPase [Nocardiopsis sp. TSRI0078]OKI12958.1 arsenic-transporting ATPase [Nocardiopsis sp. TSRI0078]